MTKINTQNNSPRFLSLLFFVEMWERFSYYGMRALLVLYLTSQLGFVDQRAYSIYSLFAAISYAGPSVAGYIADKILGFKNMVLAGGVVITIGHIMMAFATFEQNYIFFGLALIAVGTGMFKGNITNLLGSCYAPGDPARESGFTLFYVAVNVGGFLASISCGIIAEQYGWHYGFGLAGIGMFIGLVIFIKYSHILYDFGNPPVKFQQLDNRSSKLINIKFIASAIFTGIIVAIPLNNMLNFSDYYTEILKYIGIIIVLIMAWIIVTSETKQRNNLIALSILIVFFMIFFAIEMQLGSLINLYAERNIDKMVFGLYVPAAVSQALNPLSIIIFGSLLGAYIKPSKEHAFLIFAMGLLCIALSFYVLWFGCIQANTVGQSSYIYLVIGMFLMGAGEVCVAPFVQSQTTLLAPANLKGFIMGVMMLSLAYSNLAGNIVAKFMSVPTVDGTVDPLISLEIYQAGFLQIANFNLLIFILFLAVIKFIRQLIRL